MSLSLLAELKRAGFHSSIATTFSVDPAFYDSTVQYKLRVYGCRNNILIADQSMLTKALMSTPDGFQKAGAEYCVKGITRKGCFHPKIFARFGKRKARIIIGSANTTCAGWGRNLEVLGLIDWRLTDDRSDNDIFEYLIKKTTNYLSSLTEERPSSSLEYKLDLLYRESPWLNEEFVTPASLELEDDSAVDFLFGGVNQPRSIYSQFTDKIDHQPEGITIISPYWDSDLNSLKRIWKHFGELPTDIWININQPELSRSEFPVDSLTPDMPVKFYQIPSTLSGRFPHAKIMCLHTPRSDHVLFGSANCTFAALGGPNASGHNDEASVYRRLENGVLRETLGLTTDQPVASEALRAPKISNEDSETDTYFDPGSIQLFGRKLVWTPAPSLVIGGSSAIIGEAEVDFTPMPNGQGAAFMDAQNTNGSLIGFVRLADGRMSRPVIIDQPEKLKSAAPSSIQTKLQQKLDSVLKGETDLILLARDMHLIFAPVPNSASGKFSARKRKKSETKELRGEDFDTPEAFRAALTVSDKIDRNDLSHADNPALQSILKIVLKGLINFEDAEADEEKRSAELAALNAGEFDDGSAHQDDDDYEEDEVSENQAEVKKPQPDYSENLITVTQFEQNKRQLLKVIGDLEDKLKRLADTPEKMDLEFVTQILFVFYLMMFGCTHEYRLETGDRRTLIDFGFSHTKDRSQIFLMRAAKMLKSLWGTDWNQNIVKNTGLNPNQSNLPVPIITLVALSQWTLAAILVETSDKKEFAPLHGILVKQIPGIFSSTLCYAIDPAELHGVIGEIQARIVSNKRFAAKISRKIEALTEEGLSAN